MLNFPEPNSAAVRNSLTTTILFVVLDRESTVMKLFAEVENELTTTESLVTLENCSTFYDPIAAQFCLGSELPYSLRPSHVEQTIFDLIWLCLTTSSEKPRLLSEVKRRSSST